MSTSEVFFCLSPCQKGSALFFWQVQFVSTIIAGAASLPDISLRESAPQIADRAMATSATVLMTLRVMGRWMLTISRNLSIRKVCSEHIYVPQGASPVKAIQSITVVRISGGKKHRFFGRTCSVRGWKKAPPAWGPESQEPEKVLVPTKEFIWIHKTLFIPHTGINGNEEGCERPSFFMYLIYARLIRPPRQVLEISQKPAAAFSSCLLDENSWVLNKRRALSKPTKRTRFVS